MTRQNLMIHTAVGTLFSVFCMAFDELLKSALLAAVGSTVSFTLSLLLGYLIKKIRKNSQRRLPCSCVKKQMSPLL